MPGLALPDPPDQPGRFCLMLVCSLTLGILAGAWTMLRPALEAFETRRSAAIALEAEVRQQQARITAHAELEEMAEGLATKVHQSDSQLPAKNDLAGLLANLSATADRHDLTLERFQPGEARSLANHQRQPLTMELRGTWPGLLGFLVSLNQEIRFLHLDRMAFIRAAPEAGAEGLRLELSLDAVWQKHSSERLDGSAPPMAASGRPVPPALPASLRLDPFRHDRGLPTYLGRIETREARWALLRGLGQSVHPVQAGDELELPLHHQHFRIKQITPEALYLQFADGDSDGPPIRLPLATTKRDKSH